MFITNSPAPSRINSAELPQRDVTVWEFAIFGYFPCIIRTVRTRSFNHKHKHRKMAIFCYFFSRFFCSLNWEFSYSNWKKTYFLALGTRPNIGRQNGPKKTLNCIYVKIQRSIIIGGTQIITNKRKLHLFDKIIHFSMQFSAVLNIFIVKT